MADKPSFDYVPWTPVVDAPDMEVPRYAPCGFVIETLKQDSAEVTHYRFVPDCRDEIPW